MEDQHRYIVPHPERQKHPADTRTVIYGERHEEIPVEKCDRCGEEISEAWKWKFCGFCGHCLRNCG